ncbi:MAG: DUF3575 domain-containing protein [Saprospiraceae bacterium]|nr:DUF3575 domain-containing protein [Saprospiraceae bacterium]
MKYKFYSFLFFFFGSAIHFQLQAQQHENIIKLGLIEPFYSGMGVAFERFIGDTKFSVQAYGSLTNRKVTIWENLQPTLFGFGGELQGRYYFANTKRKTISGIYNGVFAKYLQNKISMMLPEGEAVFLDGNSRIAGLLIGYQQGFFNRFFIDVSLGSGYHIADYSGKFSDKGRIIPSLISSGFVPKFDIKAGIAF